MTKSTIHNLSQAYVMLDYMSKLASAIGNDSYLNCLIRFEHGTGKGFFGISNSGSTDCIKERFRGVTDSLGQRDKNWSNIAFLSESCIGVTRKTSDHRIEHTREVINLFKEFESKYILTGKSFTANDLGIWLIENQIVCFINKNEQKPQCFYNDEYPFSKYSCKIYYESTDISNLTLEEIMHINRNRFSNEIREINNYNFTQENKKNIAKLIGKTCKHTLPPLDLAITYHSNMYELLDIHYQYKLNKRINPEDKKWYNKNDADMWKEWKTKIIQENR